MAVIESLLEDFKEDPQIARPRNKRIEIGNKVVAKQNDAPLIAQPRVENTTPLARIHPLKFGRLELAVTWRSSIHRTIRNLSRTIPISFAWQQCAIAIAAIPRDSTCRSGLQAAFLSTQTITLAWRMKTSSNAAVIRGPA